MILFNIFLGFISGAVLVGTSVQRTLSINRGEVLKSSLNCSVNTIMYFISVYWVSKMNIPAMIGNFFGSLIVVIWMGIKNKQRIDQVKGLISANK